MISAQNKGSKAGSSALVSMLLVPVIACVIWFVHAYRTDQENGNVWRLRPLEQ